jgi:hypothetical protein
VTTPKKLLLCHGDFEGDEMAIFNSREMQLLHLRWYDHWLKGNDTGLMEEAPVTVFVRNREIYRAEKDWPLPQTQYKKLYLAPGPSGGVASLNDGALTWEAPTAAYEPAQPAPAAAAPGGGPAGTMGRPRTAWAPEDVMAAGESKATVTASSTSYDYPDPDWSHFSGLGTAVMEDGVPNPVRKILTFATEPADVLLRDGDVVEEAGVRLQVLHTPGHTLGGICLYCESDAIAFVGDTLFADSVGRTDFPGGDMDQLIESIQTKLFTLPDKTTVYPGHGMRTTIGREKRANPYVQGS